MRKNGFSRIGLVSLLSAALIGCGNNENQKEGNNSEISPQFVEASKPDYEGKVKFSTYTSEGSIFSDKAFNLAERFLEESTGFDFEFVPYKINDLEGSVENL